MLGIRRAGDLGSDGCGQWGRNQTVAVEAGCRKREVAVQGRNMSEGKKFVLWPFVILWSYSLCFCGGSLCFCGSQRRGEVEAQILCLDDAAHGVIT